jgi:tRNA threonylcarbamoyladenosine biosynthesis protein TsaE
MSELINIWLSNAEKTMSSGEALAKTLYTSPVDILLSGELGAGKTTFLQGLAKGLGITQKIVSPTFALEQRYPTPCAIRPSTDCTLHTAEMIHIDLYRLSEKQSQQLLQATENQQGIRCIEWPEHAGSVYDAPKIHIQLHENGEGRTATITFDDISHPSREEINEWRNEMLLPEHIGRHCDAVSDVCTQLGEIFLKRGVPLRPMLLRRSAEVHDLLRFLDFRRGGIAGPENHSPEQLQLWAEIRERYAGLRHEPACAAFLREKGYPAVAEVVAVHGFTIPTPLRTTIEQQLLYYADKRVIIDQRVTLAERFEDFRKRYCDGKQTAEADAWHQEVLNVEAHLFPEGTPL